jgi:hypothetical protein
MAIMYSILNYEIIDWKRFLRASSLTFLPVQELSSTCQMGGYLATV